MSKEKKGFFLRKLSIDRFFVKIQIFQSQRNISEVKQEKIKSAAAATPILFSAKFHQKKEGKTSTRNWFLLLNSNFWNRFLRKFGKRFLFSFSPFTNYDKDPGTARSALEQRAEPKAVSLLANKNSFKARWNSAQIYLVKVSRNIKANKNNKKRFNTILFF